MEGIDLRNGGIEQDTALENREISHGFRQRNRSGEQSGVIKIIANPLWDLYSCIVIR